MKDYKTITREKVDADPGAARYMSETHLLEDWSDKLLDLVLNGPTLNGFKKDELRAMLRQTYAALKQYEQIGPMASPYMNDPSAIVARAFAELYPGIDYHAQFVPDLCDESGNRAFGLTIFPDDGLLLMPTRANIPDPQRDDWKPTTCPICGAECWETEIHRQALAAEPGLRAVCTDCGLRGAAGVGLVNTSNKKEEKDHE